MKLKYRKEYAKLHQEHPGRFRGYSIRPYVAEIAELVAEFRPKRILDYGSGKGHQYLALRVHEAWGGLLPHCYDIGVRGLSEKPEGRFGGIICTDVLEHIEEEDLPAVMDGIFGYADEAAFAFFSIACRPAKSKRLSDGRDVHRTIKPPRWWEQKLAAYERPGLFIRARYDEGTGDAAA